MRLLLHALSLADFPTILAGHGYDVGGGSNTGSGVDDDSGGIGLFWLIATGALVVITIGLLVSMSPASPGTKVRTVVPIVLIVTIIGGPLVAWTAISRSDDPSGLIVERALGLDGAPELILSLGDAALNTLDTTDGKRLVRVACFAPDGKPVLDAEQKWPFLDEPGYKYPHAHQAARRDQLQRVDRCLLEGTSIRLEAGVKGALPQ